MIGDVVDDDDKLRETKFETVRSDLIKSFKFKTYMSKCITVMGNWKQVEQHQFLIKF